jgi:diguanylate cyclase (GGDEF)-like protein
VADTEQARLEALHALEVLDTAPEERFDRLTRVAARVFNAPVSLVSLVDDDRQWFKSRHGLDALQTPRSQAFCEYAVRSHNLVVVPDATEDDRFADNPLVTGDLGIRYYAGAPLFSDCGRYVLGTLCVIDTIPRYDTQAYLDTLRDLAATASHELARGRACEVMSQALQNLDEERALHRLVIENMPATLAVINPDLTYKLVNQSFSAFSDTPPRPGMHMRDLLGEERFAIVEPYLKRALQGETVHFEAAGFDKHDNPIIYEVRYQPNFDASGKLASLTALGTDVTRRRHLERAISALARMSSTTEGSLADISREALGQVCELLNMKFSGIMRKMANGDMDVAITHSPVGFVEGEMPVARRLMEHIIDTGECLAIPDAQNHPMVAGMTPGKHAIKAFAAAPIIVKGEIIGAVGFANTAPHATEFMDVELEVVRLAASILAREIARKEADARVARREKALHEMATTDPLTNLPNRREITRLAENECDRSRRYGNTFSLAIMDIDHFKAINDTHGHAIGDATLVDTASIVKRTIRNVDRVGRIGGEEFAILLPETDARGAWDAMEKVRQIIEGHGFFSRYQALSVTACFGVVTNRKGEGLEEMMGRADKLLYEAKHRGRNMVCSDTVKPPRMRVIPGGNITQLR